MSLPNRDGFTRTTSARKLKIIRVVVTGVGAGAGAEVFDDLGALDGVARPLGQDGLADRRHRRTSEICVNPREISRGARARGESG